MSHPPPAQWLIDDPAERRRVNMMIAQSGRALRAWANNTTGGEMDKDAGKSEGRVASEKLDTVKSTIANLESRVETLMRNNGELSERITNLSTENAKLRLPMQRDDRALYVNRDGTTKNAPVIVEPRPDKQYAAGPAYRVETIDCDYQAQPVYSKFDPTAPVLSRRRSYQLAFSQGSLHVYQEV